MAKTFYLVSSVYPSAADVKQMQLLPKQSNILTHQAIFRTLAEAQHYAELPGSGACWIVAVELLSYPKLAGGEKKC